MIAPQDIPLLLTTSDDWECVHFIPARLGPSVRAMASEGLHIAELGAADLIDDAAAFDALAREFRFPSYFGRNWNAVDECLSDLGWLRASGYVLSVVDITGLRGPICRLIETSLTAAQALSSEGRPFHLVFLGDWDA